MFCAMSSLSVISVLVLWYLVVQTDAHGRLVDPPSRSSMWRFGFNTPINYDDNQLFCGGYDVSKNLTRILYHVYSDLLHHSFKCIQFKFYLLRNIVGSLINLKTC